MPDYYYEVRHQQVAAKEAALGVSRGVARNSGSRAAVRPVERFAIDERRHVIVCLGSTGGTVKGCGGRTVSARTWVSDCSRSVRSGRSRYEAFVMRSLESPRSRSSIAPVRQVDPAALRGARRRAAGTARAASYVYGLGGRELHPEDIVAIFAGAGPPTSG